MEDEGLSGGALADPIPPPSAAEAIRYAGWFRRLGSGLIDRGLSWLVFWSVFFIAGAIAAAISDFTHESQVQAEAVSKASTPWLFLIGFLLWLALLVTNRVIMEGRTGQSLGKRALGTAVVDAKTGLPIGSPRALGRWFSHMMDWLPLGAGWLAPVWDKKRQTFADAMSDCVVVRVTPVASDRPRLSRRISNWMTAHQVPVKDRVGPKTAIAAVVAIYALGFGLPIYVAVRYVMDPHLGVKHHAHGWTTGSIIETGLVALATVVAAGVLASLAPTWSRPISSGPRSLTVLKTFGLGWLAMAAGSLAGSLIGMRPAAGTHNPAMVWPEMVNSALAGPGEEIVVLALPLVFLRVGKWRWSAVFAVALVLRLAYHVYYGWPVVGFAVWALLVMVIYLRTHAILGLILAHSYWDLTIGVGNYWSHTARALMFATVVLSLIVWAALALVWKLIVGIGNGPASGLTAIAEQFATRVLPNPHRPEPLLAPAE